MDINQNAYNLINFAPYKKREILKNTIGLVGILAICLLFSSVALYMSGQYYEFEKVHQNSRIQTIKSLNSGIQGDIQKINRIKSDISSIELLRNVIHDIQVNRYLSIRIFNELSELVPDGVTLNSATQNAGFLYINGQSTSNGRVSTLMENLSRNEGVLKNPVLMQIEADSRSSVSTNSGVFQIVVRIDDKDNSTSRMSNRLDLLIDGRGH